MAILTRETTATGVTNNGAPLTNAELDNNFVELQQNKVNTTDLNEAVDDRVNNLLQAGLGIDLTYDDVNDELTIDSNHVEVACTNNSGASIAIGTPVYQTGVSGNNITIAPADADDAAKMPAIGMTTSTIANGADGTVVILGVVNGLDTSSFTAGDTVYVSATAGALTTTAPSGESGLIQNFGRVLKVNASSGSIAVMGAGRANAVPNLNDGNVFIGNASNQAEARALTGDDISGGTITSFASTGIDDNATSTAITIDSSQNVVIAAVDINGGTIDNVTIGGTTAAAGTFTTANATTVDTTNLEVTNLKAKDGTSAGSIADSTGVVTLASSVLTTTDINGGTIDGATIGGTNAGAGTFSSMTATTADINGGTVDGANIGATTAGTGKFTTLNATGKATFDADIEEQQYSLTGTAIDPANGTIQYKTLSANTTFTESLSDGEYVTLMIDDGSAYTVTWPTTTWVGGSAPTLETTGYNVIELWHVNGVLYGAFVGAA